MSPVDFPDPYVLVTATGFYAYSTNTIDANVPAQFSTDLAHWSAVGDALPVLPAWAASGVLMTWAPAVIAIDGHYLMYVALQDSDRGEHCIGVGRATTPAGPFVIEERPLTCGTGAIDPSPFTDRDGTLRLVWKYEASTGKPSRIVTQALTADGLQLHGSSTVLLTATQPWEHGVVEGPSMYDDGETNWLFYAAADWRTADYATGVARCDGPTGPCVAQTTPILATAGTLVGPGGLEVFATNGHIYGVFHSWNGDVGYPDGERVMTIRDLTTILDIA